MLLVTVEQVYIPCAPAIVRSTMGAPATQVARSTLPTPRKILAEITEGKMGGDEHDRQAPARMMQTIY